MSFQTAPNLHKELGLKLDSIIPSKTTTFSIFSISPYLIYLPLKWSKFLPIFWCFFAAAFPQEVESVSGDTSLTYDQLAQLSYTEAVLREALRLYPSVPLDSKFTTEALTFPGTFGASRKTGMRTISKSIRVHQIHPKSQ